MIIGELKDRIEQTWNGFRNGVIAISLCEPKTNLATSQSGNSESPQI